VWPIAKPARAKSTRFMDLPVVRKPTPETAQDRPRKGFDLAVAEQLADQGQLREAAEICEIFLREKGPSARAFHLLGLICDGAGDHQQASEYYRKALYLEPDHYDALIHLALLKDHNGENAAAQVLKSRALRVLERMK
jgi:chemotaxis protein methyltransferase WspC